MTTAEKVKHTAGPWDEQRIREAIRNIGELGGLDDDEFGEVDDAALDANARLIAAAPEMLDALEFAERILLLLKTEVEGLGFNAKNVFPRVKTALMKARGEA